MHSQGDAPAHATLVSQDAPPSIGPPGSHWSTPGGPAGRVKTITDYFRLTGSKSEKQLESKRVEEDDPIEIDSAEDDDDDVSTIFTTPARKDTKPNVPPPPAGEPLVLQADPLVQVPASVNAKLRSYQRDGVKNTGGILGDDMGLGKTIQTIAFLTAVLTPPFAHRRILIVAPASVLAQWQDEMKKWGLTRVVIFHGHDRDAQLLRIRNKTMNILLTSYETLTRDVEVLCLLDWAVLILDEVHRLKNQKSKSHLAAQKVTTKIKIGLSGTILQNNLDELWALINLVSSETWISIREMRARFEVPIRYGQKQNATRSELARRRVAMKRLATELKKFVLRRDKTILGDSLPTKTDQIVYTPLTPLQSVAYQAFLGLPSVQEVLHYSAPCDCGSGKTRGCCCDVTPATTNVPALLLWAIDRLTKLCNSASQLLPKESDSPEKQEKSRAMCKAVFGDRYSEVLHAAVKKDGSILSGKLVALRSLLPVWKAEGSKVLLFSKSTRMLDFIETIVSSDHGMGCYTRLDGSTPVLRRAEVVKEFSTAPRKWIFLISTNAGGLGLNLTVANRVVVFDPQWNPSHDLQAQDRAHRIGQAKDVHVLRFISGGTLEEKIYQRQVYKQQLHNTSVMNKSEKRWFKGVQGLRGEQGDLFGAANILAFDPSTVLTDEVIKRTDEVYKRLRFSAMKSSKSKMVSSADAVKAGAGDGTAADPELVPAGDPPMDGMDATMKELLEGNFDDVDENMLKEIEQEERSRMHYTSDVSGVAAVLAQAGVKLTLQFTHRNTDLLGDSAVERMLGQQAEKAHRAETVAIAQQQRRFYDLEQQNLAALASYRPGLPLSSPAPYAAIHKPTKVARYGDPLGTYGAAMHYGYTQSPVMHHTAGSVTGFRPASQLPVMDIDPILGIYHSPPKVQVSALHQQVRVPLLPPAQVNWQFKERQQLAPLRSVAPAAAGVQVVNAPLPPITGQRRAYIEIDPAPLSPEIID